jgi:hypothetical protein
VEDTTWGETTLNHNNRPALSTQLGSISNSVRDTSYQVALAPSVVEGKLGGLFSIGVESVGPNDNMYFYSRNNATHKPQLVIDYTTPDPPVVGEPPEPVIDAPPAGTTFRAGDSVAFSGAATDPEDGPLDASALTWEALLHHDTHTHPFMEPVSGITEGILELPDTGESSSNIWYEIRLRAADSDGNIAEVTRDIVPLTSSVTLATDPVGLTLSLDGSPITTPHSFTGVVGFRRGLMAPDTQVSNGKTYRFAYWSDGGAASHTIVTPDAAATYRATYTEITSDPVTVTLNPIADDHVSSKSPTRNYGLSPWMWVVKGESYAYLKFDLTSLVGKTVTSAILRVRTANDPYAGSPNTIKVLVVDDTSWGERTLTYENRPPFSMSVLGSRIMPAINTSYDVTLSNALIQGKLGGLFSVGMDSSGVDSLGFISRDSSPKPQLIVTYQ